MGLTPWAKLGVRFRVVILLAELRAPTPAILHGYKHKPALAKPRELEPCK